jgi:hypothetical protein
VKPELYWDNTPERLWRVLGQPRPTAAQWRAAVEGAAPILPAAVRAQGDTLESILDQALGEGQFGPDHWRLSRAKRIYNAIKPALPRALTVRLRRAYAAHCAASARLHWPIESRYVDFQFAIMRELLRITERASVPFIDFWPEGRAFAFVLTHDIETADGQAHVRAVADLETALGFRSAFNFVPERYRVDRGLMEDLRERGFEIGVHGLKHDGKLFRSYPEFRRRAARINRYLADYRATGFRGTLTHRHPEWMQILDMEYDSSFFDTDPFEPIGGGTMSIWPFQLGRFLELPYTLTQDYTVASVLRHTTPQLWLDKVEFIRDHRGLALLNTHPDYLRGSATWRLYSDFLRAMRERQDYHHALPKDVASWWRARAAAGSVQELPGAVVACLEAADEPGRAPVISSRVQGQPSRRDASA